MNASDVRFGQSVTVEPSRLLGRPFALPATVVERRSERFFVVRFEDGSRETVHASDMVQS